MAKFKVEFDCDTDAFEDSYGCRTDFEIKRILDKIGEDIESGIFAEVISIFGRYSVSDTDNVVVGYATFEK